MDAYTQLCVATALFVGAHFVTSSPLRPVLVAAMGEKAYLGLYSLASLAAIGWMIWAYNRAPIMPLWLGPHWLPAAVMPFALVLIASGYARNPTMVMAERLLQSSEPARGMIRVTRHPIMGGVALWALAHLAARGDLKSVIFFGGFFALAALGSLLMDQRKARALGEDWKRFAAATSYVPFVAIAQGRNRFDAAEIGWRRPAIGLAAYAGLIALHPWLIGVRAY
jgi:uncharacterized membrane protein